MLVIPYTFDSESSNLNFEVFRLTFANFTRLTAVKYLICRGGSRGRVQGVRTPSPPLEMTCGFLIQLVFCKKSYVVYWC